MIVAQYFDYFMIFSFVGWVYECIYCTIREHHWQNRGFLFGPVCPIYGSGVVAAMIVFHLLPLPAGFSEHSPVVIFVICFVGSAIMEYGTSVVLERFFHAVWWDYSDMPFNINGRICLPASCGFGAAGIVVVKGLIPLLDRLPIAAHPIENELLSLVFAFIFGMDMALTVASLTRMMDHLYAIEAEFNLRMEAGYQTAQQGPAAVGSAVSSAAKAAAISAGETAVIAAMLASDSAKAAAEKSSQEMSERMHHALERLDWRDQYHLRSIRAFHPRKDAEEERIRSFFAALQKNAAEYRYEHKADHK